MAPQLTHADIESLLGAYSVDAVDAHEAAIIDAHLPECPRCRAEVTEHREAAALLAFSGASAPDGVWSRITASIDDGTPPPLHFPPARAARAPGRPFLTAAAGIAAAVIAVLSVQVVRQNDRVDRLVATADQHGLDEAAAAAAVDPGARIVHLASDDHTQTIDAVVLPDGHGYLVRAQLPTLTRDKTYQLWGILGAQTVSLGVLGPDPTITSFQAAGPLTALAVTAEHAGGAVAPTTRPLVQGFLEPT